MPIHVAGDGHHLMGFAGGASAELEGYHCEGHSRCRV